MGHRGGWHRWSLVWLGALEPIVGRRWTSIRWNEPIGRFNIAAIAVGSRSLNRVYISVGCRISVRSSRICGSAFLIKLVIFLSLVAPSPHANITTDSYSAALLRNDPAERRACGQPWKLLGAVHGERYRLDLKAEVEVCLRLAWIAVGTVYLVGQRQSRVLIGILGLLDLLVQVEVQTIPTLMAH